MSGSTDLENDSDVTQICYLVLFYVISHLLVTLLQYLHNESKLFQRFLRHCYYKQHKLPEEVTVQNKEEVARPRRSCSTRKIFDCSTEKEVM